MQTTAQQILEVKDIEDAYLRLKPVINHTPLLLNDYLSEKYACKIYLKREDLQIARSYKLRGAYNKISRLPANQLKTGIVCASAGNHSQGVAYVCEKIKVKGIIFMPNPTPNQKIKKVKRFGKNFIEIVLVGDTFDDAYAAAQAYAVKHHVTFVHPFDDPLVMAGQGTVAYEILEDFKEEIDFLFAPIGGGGLCAGVGTYLKDLRPNIKIIGAEPKGAPAMYNSINNKALTPLKEIDVFVDGAAVKNVGEFTFKVCSKVLDDVALVEEGKICSTILDLYNEEAIVAEPAGVLSISVLDQYAEEIKGKNVICILSGGNNDITRMEEIKERSLIYEGLKCYFIIRFPQRAGALKEFLNEVLSENEDIAHFEYTKKTNREKGPALVGLELKHKGDYAALIDRMEKHKINYQALNDNQELFEMLV